MTAEKKLQDFREGRATFSEELKAIVNDNETGIRMDPDWSGGGNLLFPRRKKRKSRPVTQRPKSIHFNISRTDVGMILDLVSFVSDLNDANLFMIREENVYTPHADACLHGITRGLDIRQRLSFPTQQKGQSPREFAYATFLLRHVPRRKSPIKAFDVRYIMDRSSPEVPERKITALTISFLNSQKN